METLLQETDVDITRFPNLSKTDEEMDEYDRIQQRIARYNEALAVRSGYKDEGKPEGYSDEAWTALRRGGEQLKMMLYAGAAAAGEITGAKSLQDWGETEALRKIDEINKRFAPSVNSFMDVPGDSVGQTFDNAFRYLLSAAGETIPTMIPSLIAGAGVGAIAGQVGKKALVAKATEQLTRNLTARYGQRKAGEMIARHALNIKRIADAANAGNVRAAQIMGAFGVNYPLSVGEVYQGMMDSEEGASGALAFGFGVPFAALDTLPEVMAIDKLIGPGAGRRFAKTFADRAKIAGITDLQLALSETGTELTQDIIAKAAAMINDPSKKFTDQDFVELADVAIRTFIGMGSTFGAAAGLRQAVIAPSSDPRVNQKQSEIERKAAEMSTPFGAAGIINEERQRGTGRPEAEIIADQARLENEEAQLRRELETAQEEEAVRIRASIEEIERRKADNAAELTRLRNQDGGRFGEAEGSQLQEDGAEAERGAEERASPEFAAKLQAVTSRFMAGRTRSPDERQRGILQEIARKEIARDKITERLRALSERPEQASPAEDAEFSALAKTEKALGTDIAELTASLRIDPSETKPIRRSKSPAVPAYLRDNPFSRPRYEVKKSEIDAIIDGARESDPRDAQTKEWLKEAIDQYIPLIDELGVKVEYGKTGRAGYNYQTNAILLPSPEEYRKAASYGKDDLSKMIEEEAIHAAQFKALRDEFEASTDTNFGSFLKKKIDRLVEDIERADSDILKKIARGYIGPRAKVTDNTSRTQLYIEFERAVIQRMRTGQLTEDLRAAKKEAQAGSAAARTFIDSVLEALERYRAAIVRFINRATSPKRIQERLKQVNAILDEFGIINRPTQLDSTIVSDTNESNIPTGQRELQRQDQQEEAGGTAQNQKTQQEQSLPQEEGLVSSAADDRIATTVPKSEIERAITRITDKIAGGAKVKFVSSVPATVRANLASLKNRMGMLKISKETHPTVVSWLAKNDRVVPWATVRTLDQLKEFVASRLAERMQPEQYEITVEGSIGAEQAELAALRARADDGDREAARALELHRQGGWERVLDGYVNPQRKASIDSWKRYLTKENEEYAKDVFWQDLAWDIPESYLRSDRGRGLGETVNLNQGALAQLREETQTKNISLPKAYRELMRQFAIASAKDKVTTGQGKTWIYIPWKGEDPENFAANVQKLKDLSNDCYCTKTYNAEPYLSEGSFWMLQENGRTKVAIRLNEGNSKVAEIKSEDNTDQIPEEYVDDVMGLLKQRNIPGAELFIAQNEKDPQRQIELANSGDEHIQYVLAGNPNLAHEAQLILSKSQEPGVIQRLARNPVLVFQLQSIFAEDKYAQSSLAGNPSIAPEVQLILAKRDDEWVQRNLAENPSVTPEVQLILANSEYERVQYSLAVNPNITPELQLILAKNGDEYTQKNLAENPSVTPEAQLLLAKSEYERVQYSLSRNPNITPELQLFLAKSGDEQTQRNLAANQSIVPEAQLIIAKSGGEYAQRNLALSESITPEAQLIIAKSEDETTQRNLAGNPSIIPEAQLILAKSENEVIQFILAGNTSIDPEVQIFLAKNGSEYIQARLATNPSIALEAQLILAKSENETTQNNLAANPSIAPEARKILEDQGVRFSKTGADIEAYYDPSNDELVFNTSAIDSVKRAEELAYHEVNHRNVFMLAQDDAGRSELKNIIAAARPILRQNLPELLSKTGHKSLEQLKSDYGWNDENGDVAVDYELLARYAENLRGRKPPSWFERIISEIKLWLNKNFGTGLADKDVLHWLSRIGVEKSEFQVGGDIQASRRASVDQQDARYLELAKDPEANREELQRMVNEAAKKAGYDVGPVFHGTEKRGITEFFGGWWSDRKSTTREFGSQRYSAFLKGPLADGDQLRKLFVEWNGTDIDPDSGYALSDSEIGDNAMSGGPFSRFVQERGFQGIAVWDASNAVEAMAYAVFNPNQIKSADPVTYDEQGNVIPLSQRFNPESDSILFSPEQQTETTQDEALAEINQIGTDQLTKSLLGFAEEMEGKPRKRVSQASWAYKLGAAIKYDSQTNKESFEKAANYIRSRGILKVMRTFANDRSSIPQTLQNIIGPALNAYFDTFASMAQGLNSVASLPADQRLELQSEITSLAPRLNASGFNNASEAGRALQILKKTQIFAGKWDRMATLERMLSPYIKKLEKSTRANVKDLAVNLTRIADLAQEEVITRGEKVNAAIELIKRATADPKKFVRGSKASMAKNRAALKEAIDRIVFEASDAIHKFGGDEHAYQLARKLKHIIAPVRGGTDPEKSVDAMIVKALNEVFKESLRMDPTGPKKVTKTDSVRALNLLKQAIGNDTLKNQILDNLENQIAAGYAKGKSDPQYIADGYPQAFEAAREKDYARSVLEGAMKEAEQNLNVIVNKLIETSWGAGMDSIGQIKSYFREKLGGIASKEVIDRLVEDVDATLTNRAIRRLEELATFTVRVKTPDGETKTITLEEYYSDPDFYERLSSSIGGAKLIRGAMKDEDGIRTTLNQVVKMGRTRKDKYANAIAQNIIQEMGIPEEYATAMQNLIVSEIKLAVKDRMTQNIKRELDKLEESAKKNESSQEARKTMLDKLIEYAASGYLHEEKIYESIRKAHPKLKLPPWSIEMAEKIEALGEIADTSTGFLKERAQSEIVKEIVRSQPISKEEMVTTWWYYSLLSGPATTILNLGSSLLNSFLNTFWHAIQNPSKFRMTFQAFIEGIRNRGIPEMMYALKTGLYSSDLDAKYPIISILEAATPESHPTFYKVTRFGDIPILKYTSPVYVFRILKATDLLFKGAAMEARLATLDAKITQAQREEARAQAIEEIGPETKENKLEIEKRTNEIIDEKIAAVNSYAYRSAVQDSRRAVFTQEPEGVIGMLARMIGSLSERQPAIKAVVPFTNIVANVLNEQLNYTPIGFARYYMSGLSSNAERKDFLVENANGDFVQDKTIFMKALVGTLAAPLLMLASWATEDDDEEKGWFRIYGSGPRDPELRRAWQQQGHRPYSIEINGVIINYLPTPFSVMLGAIGTFMDAQREAKDYRGPGGVLGAVDQSASIAFALLGAAFASTLNQSFLSGVQSLVDVANANNPADAMKRFLGGTASSFITPGNVRELFRTIDPRVFDSPTIVGQVFRNWPVVGPSLNRPALNRYGEEVNRNQWPLFGRFIGVVNQTDPVFAVAAERGLNIPDLRASAVMGGQRMDYDTAYRFTEIAGPILKQLDYASLPSLRTASIEQANEILARNRRIAAARARAVMRVTAAAQ
jgi:hypothetical protein